MTRTGDEDKGLLLFPTREAAAAALAKVRAIETDPDVEWRVVEKSGQIFVAAFVGRDFADGL